jgi:hypothetical protein
MQEVSVKRDAHGISGNARFWSSCILDVTAMKDAWNPDTFSKKRALRFAE